MKGKLVLLAGCIVIAGFVSSCAATMRDMQSRRGSISFTITCNTDEQELLEQIAWFSVLVTSEEPNVPGYYVEVRPDSSFGRIEFDSRAFDRLGRKTLTICGVRKNGQKLFHKSLTVNITGEHQEVPVVLDRLAYRIVCRMPIRQYFAGIREVFSTIEARVDEKTGVWGDGATLLYFQGNVLTCLVDLYYEPPFKLTLSYQEEDGTWTTGRAEIKSWQDLYWDDGQVNFFLVLDN